MIRPDTLRVLTPPASEPISLEEAKRQIGLMEDQAEHDDLLAGQIATPSWTSRSASPAVASITDPAR